jgi:hypothetical protein
LKRIKISSGINNVRKYAFRVASVAAILIFISFFFFEKEESTEPPFTTNYLNPVYNNFNHSFDKQENKITFTGIPINNESNQESSPDNINIQNTQNKEQNHNFADLETSKKIHHIQKANELVDDYSFPDNKHNLQKLDNVDFKNNNHRAINDKPLKADQQINQNNLSPKKLETIKKEQSELSFWNVVSMAVNGLSKITGQKMELKQQYDANGNVKSLAFNSPNLEITAPVKKK